MDFHTSYGSHSWDGFSYRSWFAFSVWVLKIVMARILMLGFQATPGSHFIDGFSILLRFASVGRIFMAGTAHNERMVFHIIYGSHPVQGFSRYIWLTNSIWFFIEHMVRISFLGLSDFNGS